ncbi:Bcr/CflA family efflux MFS transporter [Georgenia sp. AZ-5]|uniref:Bcr/CflA family efflux MFS transporter n=1 Tax=Georgenia sp. AZ-5 TaxID=3367526 RepID=UPI003754B508
MSAERAGLGGGVVVLLAAVTAMAPMTLSFYLPALPLIAAELDAGPAQVQLTVTAALVGLAAGQLLIGSVSDATGRRPPLLVAFGGYVVTSLVIAVVHAVTLLVALRFLQGFLAAAGLVVALAVVRDVYEGVAVGKMFSRLLLVVGVAPVLAPALGAQVLLAGSWRLLFVVLAAAGAVLLVLVALTMPESLPPPRRRAGGTAGAVRSYAALLRDRTFRGLVVVAGLAMAGFFTYVAASTFLFQQTYGLTAQQYALVFGLGALTVTAGTQVAGALMGRVGGTRIVGGALAVALAGATAIGVVAATVGTGPGRLGPLLAALLPTICAVGMLLPAVPGLALALQAHDAGSAAALVGASQFGMAALGAPLTGLLGESVGTMAAVMVVAFAAAAAVMAAVARGRPAL